MAKRRNYDNIKVEIVPHYISQEEMPDLIIRALWGSKQSAAREFLAWEAERMQKEQEQ